MIFSCLYLNVYNFSRVTNCVFFLVKIEPLFFFFFSFSNFSRTNSRSAYSPDYAGLETRLCLVNLILLLFNVEVWRLPFSLYEVWTLRSTASTKLLSTRIIFLYIQQATNLFNHVCVDISFKSLGISKFSSNLLLFVWKNLDVNIDMKIA